MKRNYLVVHEPKRGIGRFLLELIQPTTRQIVGWTNSGSVIESTAQRHSAVVLRVHG